MTKVQLLLVVCNVILAGMLNSKERLRVILNAVTVHNVAFSNQRLSFCLFFFFLHGSNISFKSFAGRESFQMKTWWTIGRTRMIICLLIAFSLPIMLSVITKIAKSFLLKEGQTNRLQYFFLFLSSSGWPINVMRGISFEADAKWLFLHNYPHFLSHFLFIPLAFFLLFQHTHAHKHPH